MSDELDSAPAPSPVLPLEGAALPSPAGDAAKPDSGGSKRGGARPGAGRKSHPEKLRERLAALGAAAPSLPGTSPAPAAVPAAAAVGAPFDPEAARTFFVTVLDAADEFNAEQVAALVEKALQDRNLAEEFKGRAKLAPAMKKLAVDDLVNLARENNLRIGPGYGLAAAALQIGAQQMALRKEIKKLAEIQIKP